VRICLETEDVGILFGICGPGLCLRPRVFTGRRPVIANYNLYREACMYIGGSEPRVYKV